MSGQRFGATRLSGRAIDQSRASSSRSADEDDRDLVDACVLAVNLG